MPILDSTKVAKPQYATDTVVSSALLSVSNQRDVIVLCAVQHYAHCGLEHLAVLLLPPPGCPFNSSLV